LLTQKYKEMLQEYTGTEQASYFEDGFAPPEVAYINRLKELINTHYKKHKDQEFYAKQMCMSIKMINAMLKYCMGKTLHEMIQHRLYKEAANLIIHSRMPMKEIAFVLGLSEPAYFSRWFKSISGMGPREYRQIYQSKKLSK